MYYFTHELTLKNQNDTHNRQVEVSFTKKKQVFVWTYYIQYLKIYQHF